MNKTNEQPSRDRESSSDNNRFSLSEIINEPAEDYSSVIDKAAQNEFEEKDREALRANYSYPWSNYSYEFLRAQADPELLKLFERVIANSILCELGGATGRMEMFAATNGASLYINVDKYPGGTKKDHSPIDPRVGVIEEKEYKDDLTGEKLVEGTHLVMLIRADMLDFISRVKDASVNIVINGIDSSLIPVTEYHKSLAKEILRSTKENGLMFGNNADSLKIICQMIKDDSQLSRDYEIVKEEGDIVIIYKKDKQ